MPLKSGSKVWTLAEVLAIHETDMAKNKTPVCETRNWLREHVDTASIEDFETWLYSDSPRGAQNAYLGIKNAHYYDAEPVASELQEYYAEWMAKMDFDAARGYVEMLLLHPVHGGISAPAAHILKAYAHQHHPHHDAFFAQVLAHD